MTLSLLLHFQRHQKSYTQHLQLSINTHSHHPDHYHQKRLNLPIPTTKPQVSLFTSPSFEAINNGNFKALYPLHFHCFVIFRHTQILRGSPSSSGTRFFWYSRILPINHHPNFPTISTTSPKSFTPHLPHPT